MAVLPLLTLFAVLRFSEADPLRLGPTAGAFEDIYDSQAWGSSASASGPGSAPSSAAVRETRDFFEKLIQRTGLAHRTHPLVLADVACGDLMWIGQLLTDMVKRDGLSVQYEGFDIVDVGERGAVKRLQKKLKQDHGVHNMSLTVSQLDVTTTPLPVRATVILVKDLVNHIQLESAFTALCMLANAAEAAGWLVISSNQPSQQNVDIDEDGVGYESKPRNLNLPPFSFPEPMFSTDYLSVWRAAHIATGPCTGHSKPEL